MATIAQFKVPGFSPDAGASAIPSVVPTQLRGGLDVSGKALLQLGLNLLTTLGVILALAVIIYSGIQMITSRGEPEKLNDAKKRLYFAIIGLVIVIMAYVIVNGVLRIFGVDSGRFL